MMESHLSEIHKSFKPLQAIKALLNTLKKSFFLSGFILLIGCIELECYLSESYVHTHQLQIIGLDFALSLPVFGLLFWRYKTHLKRKNAQGFGFARFTKRKLLLLLAAMIIGPLIAPAFQGLGLIGTTGNQVVLDKVHSFAPIVETFSCVYIAPISEELIFRGLFFNYFFTKDTRASKILGIFVSGLVFGCMHEFSFSFAALMYCTMGWLLAGLYVATKDLRCPMLVHFVTNVIACLP